MRLMFTALSLLLFISACQLNTPQPYTVDSTVQNSQRTESERLNQWFERKYEESLQRSPMMLTYLGRKEQYDEINDMSESAEKEQLAWEEKTAAELSVNFDYNKLTAEARESYDIWMYQLQKSKEGQQYNKNAYIFTQFHGMQSFLVEFLINFHRVDELKDMQAYIKRIAGIGKALEQLLVRAQENAAAGTRPPKFAYEGVISETKNIIAGIPFSDVESTKMSPLWADIERKVQALVKNEKISQEQADALKAKAKVQLLTKLLPSYQALIVWFENDIKNTVTNPTGVSSQKNGKNYYDHMLAVSTTTKLTADEIHEIGLQEVARITQEMLKIKDRVGFKGTLQAFFNFIKTDEQFFYANTDQGRQSYIADTEAYLDFIEQQLPQYFGILPKADLVVKRVEAYREQDGAAQHYQQGTPDGSRPGVYYAHLSDMKSMPKNEMEGVAYHEGNPGHHMQRSIAQELTSIPTFRTQTSFTAYVEGWALYAELLAKEMGAYKNDYSDFGRLINEIWRAVRLVVDTGLHAKGWTEQQAIDYFREKTPIAEGAIISEVRRYLVYPGQATSYKIGMLKILELREHATNALGKKFDIKGFHDTILGGGAMPLAILERRVNHWIDLQKKVN